MKIASTTTSVATLAPSLTLTAPAPARPGLRRFGSSLGALGAAAVLCACAVGPQAASASIAPAGAAGLAAEPSAPDAAPADMSPDVVAEASETAPGVTAASAAPLASLTITIANVRAGEGPVLLVLVRGLEGWNGAAKPAGQARITAAGPEVSASFADLEPGTYGVKLYQDLDSDGDLDSNLFGLPTEPYGFSNDAPIRFGPPDWEAAAFEIGAGEAAVQTITLSGRQ